MADTTTTNYGLVKPEVGGSTDTWGTKINGVIDDLDQLLGGDTAVTGIDINSGSIDGTAIGSASASTGNFSTLSIGGTAITATAAELNHVDGVTSAIQTQLNGKQATMSAGSGIDISSNTISVETDLRDGITHVGLDSGDYIGFTNNSRIDFYVNGNNEFRMESDGDFHADGDVIAYSTTISDERLKKNIQGIENAVAKVGQLNGYTFEYTADGRVSAGVIAQEVEKVLPEAVSEKQLPLKVDDGQEYKVVSYDALHGLLIEAIKELTARVEELEAK